MNGRGVNHVSILLLLNLIGGCAAFAQEAPASSERPWHSASARPIEDDARQFHRGVSIDPGKTYSLAELIDFAEAHNPETRVVWERAHAQVAAWGVARSALYPALAAAAISQMDRDEALFGTQFYRHTIQTFQAALDLTYTVFDFGARAGRISAANAEVLAANFAFNDTHRRIILLVERAYYSLLYASGQEDAARASLVNAQSVQQAAEDRLQQGLATLPDVLEARSATAQSQYDLQVALGAEEVARGNLATALGVSPASAIQVQPISALSTPESIGETVEQAIARGLEQRPDLLEQLAETRAANARVKEARAPFYPSLTLTASPNAQALYGLQQTFPWGHTTELAGQLQATLNWTLFDGGARRNNLAQAEANVRGAEAQADATRDRIANEVWTAYSNFKTAIGQRRAATALLEAASQSYGAAVESYGFGVRSLLDVTAAQRVLAQARSADVTARTQVLTALADLAFAASDSIQPGARRP
jgi:outer membrane protein